MLQRRLSIGYARASRIIEMMAASGILGEYKGSQAREVMMTLEDYEKIREQMDKESEPENVTADTSETAYGGNIHVNEGQRGYVSVDSQTD